MSEAKKAGGREFSDEVFPGKRFNLQAGDLGKGMGLKGVFIS